MCYELSIVGAISSFLLLTCGAESPNPSWAWLYFVYVHNRISHTPLKGTEPEPVEEGKLIYIYMLKELVCLRTRAFLLQILFLVHWKTLCQVLGFQVLQKLFLQSLPLGHGRLWKNWRCPGFSSWAQSHTPPNILAGFKKAGVYPFHPGQVSDRQIALSKALKAPTSEAQSFSLEEVKLFQQWFEERYNVPDPAYLVWKGANHPSPESISSGTSTSNRTTLHYLTPVYVHVCGRYLISPRRWTLSYPVFNWQYNYVYTWCQDKKLLPTVRECVCGTDMRIVNRAKHTEGRCFHYPRKGCQKEVSLKKGSFLRNPS